MRRSASTIWSVRPSFTCVSPRPMVIHNLESQKLQYAMEARLRQLGWHEIEVVNEDLGRSAAGSVTRTGFERMVAEVCLGKVGAVAAREAGKRRAVAS